MQTANTRTLAALAASILLGFGLVGCSTPAEVISSGDAAVVEQS